jgi:diguanylate cyclase (GGDEF)-like protein/PAS domain S-box-containing protein
VVEDALFLERERAVVTLNSIGDAVLCTDISGNITYLNIVAETMTGWTRTEAIGKPLAEIFHILDGATRELAQDPMALAVSRNKTVGLTGNCILVRRDGYESAIEDSAAPIHDRHGAVIGAVVVFHDVTATRAMSKLMVHAAQHDAVTNLANRTLLRDRIAHSISLAHRQKRSIGIIFLDLDHFKNINDSLGHAIGDLLLQSVAKRLVASVRGSDTVSRQGGDEFAILLSEIAHVQDAGTSAAKMLTSLRAPHSIAGHELHIDGSVGISIYPQDGENAEALIKNADTAMYHAKEQGRNNLKFFKTEMNVVAVARQSVEAKLRRAVQDEDFVLHYQPKINLASGEITGIEALVRWWQDDVKLIYPAHFIPVAEDSGLIIPIGRWVMREACRQARAWQHAGLPVIPIAVNVSAIESRNPGFVAGVHQILRETGLEPHLLEIELTEGVLIRDVESTFAVLNELKSIGIRFAMDDLGTGYSSLSYLRRLPIDVLKIDQSFVRDHLTAPFPQRPAPHCALYFLQNRVEYRSGTTPQGSPNDRTWHGS